MTAEIQRTSRGNYGPRYKRIEKNAIHQHYLVFYDIHAIQTSEEEEKCSMINND